MSTTARNVYRRDEDSAREAGPVKSTGVLCAELFGRMLFLERKRSERSGRAFLLMLLEFSRRLKDGSNPEAVNRILEALSHSTRDTDVVGWYKRNCTLGVIFTEVGGEADGRAVVQALLSKVTKALAGVLGKDEISEVDLTFRAFPGDGFRGGAPEEIEPNVFDEMFRRAGQGRLSRTVKRAVDIAGSLGALLAGLPVFLAVTLAVRLTSKGPVLFRQERVGQLGRRFTLLKFRSMYCNNDQRVHEEFVKRFITDKSGCASANGQAQYKLARDPRVTPIGQFLRKTSLDELPQFLNVLRGDMSLVGPRPPLPYEVECYQAWHKARLLAAKPGLTGFWQVAGRSRVKFDDMVRMDLRYANSWSVWLDLRILLQTPYAVFSAKGAH